MECIYIFGTGSVAELLMESIDIERVTILGFLNSNPDIKEFHNYPVFCPDSITGKVYDFVLIASGYYLEMEKILWDYGVPKEKIVAFMFDECEFFEKIKKKITSYLNTEIHRSKVRSWMKDDRLFPEICGAVYWKNNASHEVCKDFVKEQFLFLMAQEIERKGVRGHVAELGVFKGDFTIMLRKAFPSKRLYLFDTFCGFDENDLQEDETVQNKVNEGQKFKDTSQALVLSRLGDYRGECVIKAGVFPKTFDLWKETFCFVSVDLNLKIPVEQSLLLFYPRLDDGGVLMISDYNAPFYEGTREAVIQFCEKYHAKMLPLPDSYGSAVIIK